jgi:hypothetical protein
VHEFLDPLVQIRTAFEQRDRTKTQKSFFLEYKFQ